jgi:hypothetical protein
VSRQSETIGKLAEALAAAQAQLTNVAKTKTADTGKYIYAYADIAAVLAVTRPILSAHKLAVVQLTFMEDKVLMLETRLVHSSGEWLSSIYPVCAMTGHQQMGAALTYARRYAYCALVGVAAEGEDDDGASAAEPRREERPAPTVARPRTPEPESSADAASAQPSAAAAPARAPAKPAAKPASAAEKAAKTHPLLVGDGKGRDGLHVLCRKALAINQKSADYTTRAIKAAAGKLDAAKAKWDAWHESVPNLTPEQEATIEAALDYYERERLTIDAAITGTDPEKGELADAPTSEAA